jgi:hypothetical protein
MAFVHKNDHRGQERAVATMNRGEDTRTQNVLPSG